MIKKLSFILYLAVFLPLTVFSAIPKLTESSKISLLTCSPNTDAVYAVFGHTGLRVHDDSVGIDVIFDYGVFDFNSDNFLYRFVKGETDYRVGDRPYNRFLFEYRYRESGVDEQVLNLSLEERQAVFDALLINLRPENQVYRYNFFYDNCATRPRDIIKDNIHGKIDFKPYTSDQTYRDLVDECQILTPWNRFGINLVIGSGADKIISERQKDFLPIYLHNAFENAVIISDQGDERPLVLTNNKLLNPSSSSLELIKAKEAGIRAFNTPLYFGLALLLIAGTISYLSYFKRKRILAKVFDTLLFITAGLAGSIIFFLMFFSEHPCVDANWNLVWLNPLALFFGLLFFVKPAAKCVIYYHFINFVALTLFLLCIPITPQTIDVAFIPYISTLWLRSGINFLEYKQNKIK